MKTLLVACLIVCLFLGCASTSAVKVDEELYVGSYDGLDYPYDCLNSPYPWYGLYPYDIWYYDDDGHDYYYYPLGGHHYPYYLWRRHHPKLKRPRFAWIKPHRAGERIANIRKYRSEAREQRIGRVREARQHRIEIRRDRASSFRSSFHRSRPAYSFRGGMEGFRRR